MVFIQGRSIFHVNIISYFWSKCRHSNDHKLHSGALSRAKFWLYMYPRNFGSDKIVPPDLSVCEMAHLLAVDVQGIYVFRLARYWKSMIWSIDSCQKVSGLSDFQLIGGSGPILRWN